MFKKYTTIFWFFLVTFSTLGFASDTKLVPTRYDERPNSIAYYYGHTVNDALSHILVGQFTKYPETMHALEWEHTLALDNPIRRFFYPIVSVVQFATVVAVRNDHQPTIYEFAPSIVFRFTNFPWNEIITTSLAIGEGVSYTTRIPSLEKSTNVDTKRLLNFLMLEATFAHPSLKELDLLLRIHHRSGAFGLYHAGNTGSNEVSLGLRYSF